MYFDSVLDGTDANEVTTLDFSEFTRSTFEYLLQHAAQRAELIPTNAVNPTELIALLNKLAAPQTVDRALLPGANVNFDQLLIERDRQIRRAELELRRLLYTDEEGDYRHIDEDHRIEVVAQRFGYDLTIRMTPGHWNKAYWGVFDNDPTGHPEGANREVITPPLHYLRPKGRRPGLRPSFQILQAPYPTIGHCRRIATNNYTVFNEIFNPYTQNSLTDFDYSNCCIAGGAVFQALTGHYQQNTTKLSDAMLLAHPVNDIDIFLVTKDRKIADATVARILAHFNPARIHRSENALSFRSATGLPVQIILRLYNSITQIITGFDIDSCTVAYDGRQLYATPRFCRAMELGYNLADPERQSTTYAGRLLKYLLRGVAIAVPGYDEKKVVPDFWMLRQPRGLAAVVTRVYNYFLRSSRHLESDYLPRIHFVGESLGIYYGVVRPQLTADQITRYDELVFNGELESELVLRQVMEETGVKMPYRIYGPADRVGREPANGLPSSLPVELVYRTRNPGSQWTNSFQPLSEPWFEDLYMRREQRADYRV